MSSIPLQQVNNFLLDKQHLTPQTQHTDLVRITNDLVGLHATIQTTPYLSLFARSPAFKKPELERLLYETRELVKIRCVRKTIFVHTKTMLPMAYSATTALVADVSRRYMLARGISEGMYTRRSREIQNLLKEGDKTASEIKAALQAEEDISAILYTLCDSGLLIRAKPVRGWKDKNHRYGLFSHYLPDVDLTDMDEEQALSGLIEKYICAYGPVKKQDLIWWLGLGKTRARRALDSLQPLLCEIEIPSLPGSFLLSRAQLEELDKTPSDAREIVSFLPALDSFLMAYIMRERYLDRYRTPLSVDRSGNITSTILLDGKIIGVWDYEDGEQGVMKVLLFEGVPEALKKRIHAQAFQLGTFMHGNEVDIQEITRMTPLTDRTAGGFMTPLKDT